MAKFTVLYRIQDNTKVSVSGAPLYSETIDAENYFYDRPSDSYVFRTAAKTNNRVATVSLRDVVSIRKVIKQSYKK